MPPGGIDTEPHVVAIAHGLVPTDRSNPLVDRTNGAEDIEENRMTKPGRDIKDILRATLAKTGKRFGPPDGWSEALALAESVQLNERRHTREVDAFRVGTIGAAEIARTVDHLLDTATRVEEAQKRYHSVCVRVRGTTIPYPLWQGSQHREIGRLALRLTEPGWSDDDVQAYLDAVSRDIPVLEQNMEAARSRRRPIEQD